MADPAAYLRFADEVTRHCPPRSDLAIEAIEELRAATRDFIYAILRHTRPCADRTAAIRKAREAMMTAIASVVVPQGLPPE